MVADSAIVRWDLVGRAEELAHLSALLREPASRGAVIAGAAGVGKSRLGQELLAELPPGAVEAVTATASAQGLPLGVLAHLVPDGGPWEEPAVLFGAVDRVLRDRRGEGAVVLAVDDAHLLDPVSAAYVFHAVTTGSARALLTVRSGEPAPDAVARLSRDGHLERVELQPLSRREFALLLEQVLEGPVEEASLERLWAATEGNLLFLRELVLDALDGGRLRPEHGVWRWSGRVGAGARLSEVVAAHLGELTAPARHLLEVVASAEPLEVDLLRAVVPDGELAEEERTGRVVVEEHDRRVEVRMGHPLYGEVLRAAMPVSVRRDIQRALAAALAATGARRAGDRLRLAVWQEGAGVGAEPGALVQAAATALGAFDPLLAERLAAAAVEAGGGFPASLLLGRSLLEQDRYADAEEVLAPLAGREPDDAELEQLAYARASCVGWGMGRVEDGLAILREAAGRAGDPAVRGLLDGHRATLLAFAGRFSEAAALGRTAVAEVTDDVVRLRALTSIGVSLVMDGRIDEALALNDRELPVALALADRLPRAPAWVLANRLTALIFAGRLDEALELVDGALGLVRGVPTAVLAQANAYRGRAQLALGAARTARRLLIDASVTLRAHRVNLPASWCLSLAAEAAALVGDHEEALRLVEEAEGAAEGAMPGYEADARRARAWVLALAGRHSAAVLELVAAADLAASRGQRVFELLALGDVLRLGGSEHAARAAAVAEGIDGAWGAAVASHARAVATGSPDDLAAAAARYAAAGLALPAAELEVAAAGAFHARALRARAAESSRRARELLAGCEGASTPALRALPLVRLSRREREVAELAAAGESNAAIADLLGVSVRTVESHLYSVFGKLGIGERAALPDALATLPRG